MRRALPRHGDAGLRAIAADAPGLRLLVLHGSRARGEAHAGFDPDRLLAALAAYLNADRIDLADLGRAGALLRYRAARDAVVVFEHEAGAFERFWLDAVDTWCDLAPILEPAYARVLDALPR